MIPSWKMLGVPIGLQVGIDLGVNQENAGRAFIDPGPHRIQIGDRPYCRGPCTIAACNGGEIRFRKLHDIDRITLAPEEMDFGSVRTVVVHQDAHSQSQTNCGFKIGNRHHESAVARAEHRELAWICYREADRTCQTETDRLKRMTE